MRFWVAFCNNELALSYCDCSCCTVNKQADNC
jgi:hypothetical protein